MVSRRTYLKTGLAGVTLSATAGCIDPNNPTEGFGGNSEPTFDQTVEDVTLKKLPEQYSNLNRNIIITSSLANTLDVGEYEQIRVRTKSNPEIQWQQRASLVTTRFDSDFNTPDTEQSEIAWMTEQGLRRIGLGTKENSVNLTPFAPNPNIETRDRAESIKDIMEQSIQSDNTNEDLIVCSPHGGDILSNSERQALFFASQEEFNSWTAVSYGHTRKEAYNRFYVNPNELNPTSFYKLNQLTSDEYEYAVSFVLLDDPEKQSSIIIGGLAEIEIKRVYASALRDALPSSYSIRIDTNGEYDGSDTRNFVNRLTENGVNGIQIAQTRDITRNSWRTVAQACLDAHKSYLENQ